MPAKLTPNERIKVYFEKIYESYTKDAILQSQNYFHGLKLDQLDINEQIIRINEELIKIKTNSDFFYNKEYIHFAKQKSIIEKIFRGRLLLLELNEHGTIKEGFQIFYKENILFKKMNELKSNLPLFEYNDFLKNEHNLVFYQLQEKPFGSTLEDYQKMRLWQTAKLIQRVHDQAEIFKFNFIKECNKRSTQNELINLEQKHIQHIFKNSAELNTTHFISELEKLVCTTSIAIRQNLKDFHNSFNYFNSTGSSFQNCTPSFFERNKNNIPQNILAEPPICNLALILYATWLDNLKSGSNDELNLKTIEQLFVSTYNQQLKKIGIEKEKFLSDCNLDSISPRKYSKILIKRLNELENDFEELFPLKYFPQLPENEKLKWEFIFQTSISNDLKSEVEQLKLAINLYEWYYFIMEELDRIQQFCSNIHNNQEALIQTIQISYPLVVLSPNPDLFHEYFIITADLIHAIKNNSKPLYFLINEFKSLLCILYHTAQEQLKEIIESKENGNIKLYVNLSTRDLSIKKASYKKDKITIDECFSELQKIYEAELKYLDNIQISPEKITYLLNEKNKFAQKKLSFQYRYSDTAQLKNLLFSLQQELEFLDNRTTIEEFIRITTSEDIEEIADKIYLGCPTNEFRYIALLLNQYFFKKFNPTNIHKSKIFISNFDNPISRDTLYNSPIDNLQTKTTINKIFKQNQ